MPGLSLGVNIADRRTTQPPYSGPLPDLNAGEGEPTLKWGQRILYTYKIKEMGLCNITHKDMFIQFICNPEEES